MLLFVRGDDYMANIISKCPSCGGTLNIAVLRCPDCGMELHNDFRQSPFDSLTADQTEFLVSFLRQRGNMSSLQAELGISYPTAKKKLDDLLTALKLADNVSKAEKDEGDVDMSGWSIPKTVAKHRILSRKCSWRTEDGQSSILRKVYLEKFGSRQMVFLFFAISFLSNRPINTKFLM